MLTNQEHVPKTRKKKTGQNDYSLVRKLMKLGAWVLHQLSEKAVLGRLSQ